MKKSVGVYLRKGRFYVLARHRTQAGFWIEDSEIATGDVFDVEQLGVEISRALSRSQNPVPTPLPDIDLVSPMLRASGTSSYSAFVKLSKTVGVTAEEQSILVTPYRNLGSRKGYDPILESVVKLPLDSPELGKVVFAAFEIAT